MVSCAGVTIHLPGKACRPPPLPITTVVELKALLFATRMPVTALPGLFVSGPVKVLEPESVSVPAPNLVKPAAPSMVELIVAATELVMTGDVPVSVSVLLAMIQPAFVKVRLCALTPKFVTVAAGP